MNEIIYGRLIALNRVGESRNRTPIWRCQCMCGKEVMVSISSLRHGHTKSCGCLSRELASQRLIENPLQLRHGDARNDGKAPEYFCWYDMKTRCLNPKHKSWKYYGGRGITVCERWMTYENFIADMGRRPSAKHSIDRINNDGNYEPDNCRWATRKEQANNQRKRQPNK